MTAPFFRVIGPTGTLVCDKNTVSVNYLGKATYQSTTQATGSVLLGGKGYGFATYKLTTSITPVLPFITLPLDRSVRLMDMTYSAGVWTFNVYCGTSSVDADGFQIVDNAVDVYVFGRLTSAGSVGLKMRDDAGVLTHVFTDTDGPPLAAMGQVSLTAVDTSAHAIPVLTKPAIIGMPQSERVDGPSIAGGKFDDQTWMYAWERRTGDVNNIYQKLVYNNRVRDDASIGTATRNYASESLLIEANGLT